MTLRKAPKSEARRIHPARFGGRTPVEMSIKDARKLIAEFLREHKPIECYFPASLVAKGRCEMWVMDELIREARDELS